MAKATTNDELVAIKTMKNDVYAGREIEILSDLSREPHPNIVLAWWMTFSRQRAMAKPRK